MKHWYVVHTKPRQEILALENLERQSFETWLPLIKQNRRRRGKNVGCIEPLFPRYLFIKLDLGQDNISSIRSTFGVSKLVRFGEVPTPVPQGLVSTLKCQADPSTGLIRPAEEFFSEGTEVTILEGPFAGLNAIYQADCGEERSIVLLSLLGGVQQIHIGKEQLWPATYT